MKKTLSILAVFFCLCAGAKDQVRTLDVIPMPQSVQWGSGNFKLNGVNINHDSSLEEATIDAISKFADDLYVASGKPGSQASAAGVGAKSPISSLKGIYFLRDGGMKAESYRIEIGNKAVKVTAPDHNGFLYAISTIRQMLPEEIYSGRTAKAKWVLPCCTIEDYPRFAYRGVLFDCGRHFFKLDVIKKLLDVMAMYKLNRLHWHLTEDQGWRAEIKKFPRLTEVGAYRNGTQVGYEKNTNDHIRYGGYYTQEEMKEVVAYAARLGITVVPEVDLPGHMVAALASYPELGCTGGPYEVEHRWGVAKEVLCAGQEKTYEFLFGVLDEICEIFPSEYIHIGGDECPKTRWKECPRCQAKIAELGLKDDANGTKEQRLQNYVTKRVQDHLAAKGRKIIGWDEILEGDLGKGATVMSWRGTKGGIKASAMGFDVIMTPNTYCYFDYRQGETPEDKSIGAGYYSKFLTTEIVYGYEPFAGLADDASKHILGVQANVWTEHIASTESLEYMLLPRLFAISEVQWCRPENKDYGRFCKVVREKELKIMDILGYGYRPF